MRTLLTILALCSLSFGQTTIFPKTTVFPKTTIFGAKAGGASATFVKSTSDFCTGSTTTCPTVVFGSNTTAGNGLVAIGFWCSGVGGATGYSETFSGQGATWTTVVSTKSAIAGTTDCGELGVEIGTATGITGGSTGAITCTLSATLGGTGPTKACMVIEVTPFVTAGILQNTGNGTTAVNGTAISAGAITTTVNGSFVVAAGNIDDGTGASFGGAFQGSGFTKDAGLGAGSNGFGDEYDNQVSAGLITGSMTPGRFGGWAATIMAVHP